MGIGAINLIVVLSLTILTCVSCRSTYNESHDKASTNLYSNSMPIDLTKYEATDEELAMVKMEFPLTYKTMKNDLIKVKMIGKVKLDEAIALRLYSASAYSALNNSLRAKDPSALPQYANTIKAASSGLAHIPEEPCTVTRGVQDLSDIAIQTLKNKQRYKEAGFTSTSYDGEDFGGKIRFTIKSDHCRKIDWLADTSSEKEVLFPPGSEFIVDKVHFVETVESGKKVTEGSVELTHTLEADPSGDAPVISTQPDPGSVKFKKTEIENQTFISRDQPSISFTLYENSALRVKRGNVSSYGYWSLFGDTVTLMPNDGSVFNLSLGGTVQLRGMNSKRFGWLDPQDPNHVLDVFTN